MKKVFLTILIFMAMLLFTACPPEGGGGTEPTVSDYQGGVFKGPFLVGSTVTIYPLDADLNQTGESYAGDITSDNGTYDISGVETSGPVELIAEGYYFDEITGAVTSDKMTMRAITENTGIVNINIFTALEIDRVRTLYAGGMSITEAKSQAVSELFDAFGFTESQSDSGDINIGTADGAALLAVSSMFAYGRSPAEIQSLITTIRTDLGTDGTANVSALTGAAQYVNAAEVRENLQSYYNDKNLDVTVPDFAAELWSIYGSDVVEAAAANLVKLEAAFTVGLPAGGGHLDEFLIPPGVTLTFNIDLASDNTYARFFNSSVGDSFTVTNNNHTATATGPGYFRLDFMVTYPDPPYDFTITANNDGVENVVNYQVTGGAM